MSFDEARANPSPGTPRQWVGTNELMEHIGIVSKNTVTNYVKAGMPHHRVRPGGRLLFDLTEVDAWIDSRWSHRTPGRAS